MNRTEPASVKFDLTTEKATAQLADGVAVQIVVDGPASPDLFQPVVP